MLATQRTFIDLRHAVLERLAHFNRHELRVVAGALLQQSRNLSHWNGAFGDGPLHPFALRRSRGAKDFVHLVQFQGRVSGHGFTGGGID